MFNQSYDFDSVYRVFMEVNRKGKVRKSFLTTEYLDAAIEYKKLKAELNALRKIKRVNRTEEQTVRMKEIGEMMKDNAETQHKLLERRLSDISDNINQGSFRFTLTKRPTDNPDKPLYILGRSAEEYFAMQILCRNIKRAFKLSMHGRNEILFQVKQLLLEDKHPKYIFRLDIESCFESIPHDELFKIIEDNTLLDHKNKSFLSGLLRKEYLKVKGEEDNKGVPRGSAVSSALAELYLSKIDEIIKNTFPDIIYYSRYVDDIFIVMHRKHNPDNNLPIEDVLDKVKAIFAKRGLKLSSDPRKHKYIDTSKPNNASFNFDYLGYGFTVTAKEVKVTLSPNKKDKIKERIKKTFDEFHRLLSVSYDVAVNYLFTAAKLLMANTTLHSSKKGIRVGIYYSHQLLDDSNPLHRYDCYWKAMVDKLTLDSLPGLTSEEKKQKEESLKEKLLTPSFCRGFERKKLYCIPKEKMQQVRTSWR